MRLFAAFEGLIRRDGLWRGSQPTGACHTDFARLASQQRRVLQTGKRHIPIQRWLDAWEQAGKRLSGGADRRDRLSAASLFERAQPPDA